MIHRLWISFQRDTLINFRNKYFLVTLLVALIYLVAVRFAIPAENSTKPEIAFADLTAEQRFAGYVAEKGQANARMLSDETEVRTYVEENANSIGIVLTDGDSIPKVQYFFQGHENEKVRNLLALSTEAELRVLYGLENDETIGTTFLGTDSANEAPPFNLQWVPVFLFSDAALFGMVFIAALIFTEKEEGTLRAYAVSPGHIWEYVLSKGLALTVLALVLTLILVPLTLGQSPNYLHLFLIIVTGSLFAEFLGAWIAAYFDNFSQFFFPTIMLLIFLSAPSVAYFVPSFSPVWLRWLPSYPLVFGLREALFPSGNPQIILSALGILFASDVVLLLLASRVLRRQIVRA